MTCLTPLTALALASSTFAAFAPGSGARAITATSMPGTCASMPNFAVPLTLLGVSRRFKGLPRILKSLRAFSVGFAGALCLAAASTSEP
jgi:hypothetical protein